MRRLSPIMLAIACLALCLNGAVSALHNAASHGDGLLPSAGAPPACCDAGAGTTTDLPASSPAEPKKESERDQHDCPICMQIAASKLFAAPEPPAIVSVAGLVLSVVHGPEEAPSLRCASPASPRAPPARA